MTISANEWFVIGTSARAAMASVTHLKALSGRYFGAEYAIEASAFDVAALDQMVE